MKYRTFVNQTIEYNNNVKANAMGSEYCSDNNIIIIGNAEKCLSIYVSFRYNAHLAKQLTDKKKKNHQRY